MEAIHHEEVKLQEFSREESAMYATHSRLAKQEAAEAHRMRDSANKMRRSMQGQLDAATSEFVEAQQARRDASQELAKEQRSRLDEARRLRGANMEKQAL